MTGKYWSSAINIPGCEKISEACLNCYAEAAHTMHYANGRGRGFFSQPFNEIRPEWKFIENAFKRLDSMGPGQVVFAGNMCDLWHEAVPDELLYKIFVEVLNRPQHKFLFLTKRAQRMHDFICWIDEQCQVNLAKTFREAYPNVWLGVTVENQKRADERIPWLLKIPADLLWLSGEPLLEAINLTQYLKGENYGRIKKVIVGGESHKIPERARLMNPHWAYDIEMVCIPNFEMFHFKQYGDAYCKANRMPENQVFDGVDYSKIPPHVIWKVTA